MRHRLCRNRGLRTTIHGETRRHYKPHRSILTLQAASTFDAAARNGPAEQSLALIAAGQEAGLYLLFPATVVGFVSGVLNAWYFLLPPPGGKPSRTMVALTSRRRDWQADSRANETQG